MQLKYVITNVKISVTKKDFYPCQNMIRTVRHNKAVQIQSLAGNEFLIAVMEILHARDQQPSQ